MQYPSDFTEDLRKKPICGVLATAVVTRRTFAEATAAIKANMLPHQKRHGGRTYDEQICNAVVSLGVGIREVPVRRQTLQRWVAECSQADRTYIVWTAGHVMTVYNDMVMDQYMHEHYTEHQSRRCFVKRVFEVTGWL